MKWWQMGSNVNIAWNSTPDLFPEQPLHPWLGREMERLRAIIAGAFRVTNNISIVIE